ncbi:MAG: tripartite motif-containing protein 71 [Acidobacteriota bacterium]|nr:tripartite motif-containing protein 71 [Acidobacteriota bacterium]
MTSMIGTLQCPSCGAPLDYDEQSESETVRCPFCESTVKLREHERTVVREQIVYKSKGDNTAVTAGVIVAFVAVFVTGGVALFAFHQINKPSANKGRTVGISNTRNSLVPSKTAGGDYTQPELTFGSEGIGPGNFKDARSIAVDAEGRIYVAEYSGGRVQVFDATGKFLNQWIVDPKMPLRGMAADRRGTVYVVQKGEIKRYEGTTGKALGTSGGGRGFDDVATTADGGLVAFSYQNRDDILRLDSAGQVTKAIRSAISGQTDRSELSIRVAADGLGQIYALGEFNNAVFKFTPEGRYLTQFGSDGDELGQFRAPSAIAVDNQGRVYVSDFKGVQVFDGNGRYLDLIKLKGAASGLAFNDRNELFVVARTQVYKFAIGK